MKDQFVVCFPGGAGGHLIASLCSNLLYSTLIKLDHNGSGHPNKFSHRLDGRILDKSHESYIQELNAIKTISDNITVGHFRYIDELVKIGKKVIYITFIDEEKNIIYTRLNHKVNVLDMSEMHYNAIKGSDWPTYAEFKTGNIHPEILKGCDWLGDWFYKLPPDTTNICEIKFSEILNGFYIIDKLAKFLNVETMDKEYLKLILTNYRNLQPDELQRH